MEEGNDPEPMWAIALSAFLSDVLTPLTANRKSNIGYGCHIGGSLFGATVYVFNRFCGAKLQKCVKQSVSFFKNKHLWKALGAVLLGAFLFRRSL